MKKIKKCKNCQYNINYYIDTITKIETNNFICVTCNVTLSNKLEINNHKNKCIKPSIKNKYDYFCSNECKFSYYMRNSENAFDFRKNLYNFSKNKSYEYFSKGFINSNSYESYNF